MVIIIQPQPISLLSTPLPQNEKGINAFSNIITSVLESGLQEEEQLEDFSSEIEEDPGFIQSAEPIESFCNYYT